MQILTIGFVISVLHVTTCHTLPTRVTQRNLQQPIPSVFDPSPSSLDSSLGISIAKQSDPNDENLSEVPKSTVPEIAKATPNKHDNTDIIDEAVEDLGNDYLFLTEKMPDLPEDEYIEIDENATPFEFLKKHSNAAQMMSIPQRATLNGHSSQPIFISVPVYINAAGGLSFHFQIGSSQPEKGIRMRPALLGVPVDVPPKTLNPTQSAVIKTIHEPEPEELSPTSQFNRLLRNYNQVPTRKVSRTRLAKPKRRKSSKINPTPLEESRNVSYKFYL